MLGLLVCVKNEEYKGVCQVVCLSDYAEDKKIGGEVQAFLDKYVDEETQLIECSAYSIYDARQLCEKIENRFGDECEVIACSDVDESVDSSLEFIGYDSCADDYYTSVIGMGYLDASQVFYDDEPFFEELDLGSRNDYYDKLNEYGLFDDKNDADEITDYCNYLVDEYYDMFQNAENFRTVKIYI